VQALTSFVQIMVKVLGHQNNLLTLSFLIE